MTEPDDLRAPVLSRWERATGLALGACPDSDRLPLDSVDGPRAALARCLESALQRQPCFVSFSGGRDSSAVLAAATEVARSRGLPGPVPVTLRFPGVDSAHETEWQELAVRHLRLQDWERIVVEDELDLVGPVARAALRRHGLLWPPNAHVHVPILDRARGGCLLTGWDGDGLFGDWRWARAQAVLRGRIRPEPRDLLRVGLALAPTRLRRRWLRLPVLMVVPWVRSEARSELEALVRADAVQEPRRWNHRIAYFSRRRYVRLAVRSLDLLGRVRGVEVCNPLLDPGFLAALARAGAAAGFGDRTRVMRELFGNLLPAELIARGGKAEFGRALWREEARSFAACWDGRGVDTALVDPDQLRKAWDVPSPLFGANTLLQQAWLAAHEK